MGYPRPSLLDHLIKYGVENIDMPSLRASRQILAAFIEEAEGIIAETQKKTPQFVDDLVAVYEPHLTEAKDVVAHIDRRIAEFDRKPDRPRPEPPARWTVGKSDNGLWCIHGPDGKHFANVRLVAREEEAERLISVIERAPELLECLRDAQGFLDISDVRALWARRGESHALIPLLNRMLPLLRSLSEVKA